MKYRTSYLLIVLLLLNNGLIAQFNRHRISSHINLSQIRSPSNAGLIKSKSLKKAIAVPVILLAAGLYATTDNDLINNVEVSEERDEVIPKFRHRADDYLQFVPVAAVYGLNALGVKGKNDFENRPSGDFIH